MPKPLLDDQPPPPASTAAPGTAASPAAPAAPPPPAASAVTEPPPTAPPTAQQLADAETAMGLAPTPKTAAPVKAAVPMGLMPKSIEEGWRLANMLARSELVPKNFRNKPEDVMVAIQMGTEIGLPPMQAMQSIAVINGRPGVWGDGFLALIMASPFYVDHDEYYAIHDPDSWARMHAEAKRLTAAGDLDDAANLERRLLANGMIRVDGLVATDLTKDTTTAICTFVRRGKATPVTRHFTIAQAKKAHLLGKEGPWQTYPDRMLAMRARAFAGRDAFPDILRGIGSAEELQDAAATNEIREVHRLSTVEEDAARA